MPDLSVGLDVSAVPVKPAGAGRYIVELASALDKRNLSLHLFTRRDDSARWSTIAPQSVQYPRVPTARPLRLVYEKTRLKSDVRDAGVDVMHSPHYTIVPGLKIPRVVSIHDLTFFTHPQYHERSKVLFFRRAIERATKEADALVCVSDYTAQILKERFSPRGEVVVIDLGIDRTQFHPETSEDDQLLVKKLTVETPYVLFLGTLEPRKGVDKLVAAFSQIAEENRDLSLVLAGQRGWHFDSIAKELSSSKHRDRIRLLGFVDDESVPALLRNAEAVAYPSAAEGFGLPILEALSCGATVVAHDDSAQGALFGNSTLHPENDSVPALAEALTTAINDPSLKAHLRQIGLAAADSFSWERNADAHVELYSRLSAESH